METSLAEARFMLSFDMISFDIRPLLSRSTVILSGNIVYLGSNSSFSDGGVFLLNEEYIAEVLSTRVR